MSALAPLQRFLTHSLELDRHGASVFVRDDNTLIVTDNYVFRSAHYKLLTSKFPHISIDIISSPASKSGFFVLFSCPSPYNSEWQRSLLLLGMHAMVFFATFMSTLGRAER